MFNKSIKIYAGAMIIISLLSGVAVAWTPDHHLIIKLSVILIILWCSSKYAEGVFPCCDKCGAPWSKRAKQLTPYPFDRGGWATLCLHHQLKRDAEWCKEELERRGVKLWKP